MFGLRIPLLEQRYCSFPLAFLPSLYQGIFQVSILTFPFFFSPACYNPRPAELAGSSCYTICSGTRLPKACTASTGNWEIKVPFSENTAIPGSQRTARSRRAGEPCLYGADAKKSCFKRSTHFKTNRVNI